MNPTKSCDFILERVNIPELIVLNTPDKHYTCGRGRENHISCASVYVSREHCLFIRTNNNIFVLDLKSANGIYINGVLQETHKMLKLEENDIIGVGCPDLNPRAKNMFAYKLHIQNSDNLHEDSDANALSETLRNSNISVKCPDSSHRTQNNHSCSTRRRANLESIDSNIPSKAARLNENVEAGIHDTDYVAGHRSNTSCGKQGQVSIKENQIQVDKDIEVLHDSSINANNKDTTFSDKLYFNHVPNESNNKVDNNKQAIKQNYLNDHITKTSKIHNPVQICGNDTLTIKEDTKQARLQAYTEGKSGLEKTVNNTTRISVLNDKESRVLQNNEMCANSSLGRNIEKQCNGINTSKPCVVEMPTTSGKQNMNVQETVSDTPEKEKEYLNNSNQVGRFVYNEQFIIKLEDELQITDDEEEMKDLLQDKQMYAVSPIKLKKLKGEPKTRFSEVDIVNLSDSEDDVFPCSQLFDTAFDVSKEIKMEIKQEPISNNGGFHSINEDTDIILLTDSEDEDNPWLQKLSRSQIMNDDNEIMNDTAGIKEEPTEQLELTEKHEDVAVSEPMIIENNCINEPMKSFKTLEQEIQNKKDQQCDNKLKTLSVTLDRHSVHLSNLHCRSESTTVETTMNKSKAEQIHEKKKKLLNKTSSQTNVQREINQTLSLQNRAKLGTFCKKSSTTKKVPQIIEPPCMPQGKRRSSTQTDKKMKESRKKSVSKLTTTEKKELEEAHKVNEYVYNKEQKHRKMTHKWADCLPPSKPRQESLSKEEKRLLANDRKEKLKQIAVEKKKAMETKDQKAKRGSAKPKTKVSLRTRGDLLIDEMQAVPNTDKLSSDGCVQTSAGTHNISDNTTNKSILIQPNNERKEDKIGNIENNITKYASISKIKIKKKKDVSNKNSATNKTEESVLDTNITVHLNKTQKSNISVSSTMPVQTENSSPNIVKIKKTKKHGKKSVHFSSNIATIHVFEIDPHNALKKLVGKDAPIPIEKLQMKKRRNDSLQSCPKLEEFLLRICSWNPVWLEEQKHLNTIAPVIKQDELIPMLFHYQSFDEYYKIALPLLLLEIWCGITKEFETIEKNPKRPTMMCSIVENSIAQSQIPSTNLHMTTLMLEVLVTKDDLHRQAHPIYGDLVFFEYVNTYQGKHVFHKVFAYVTNIHQTIVTPNIHYNKDLKNYVKSPYALLTYTMLTRPLVENIPVNRVQRLRAVTYLRANMRMIQALQYLPISPLTNLILNPQTDTCQLPIIDLHNTSLITKDKLNQKQLEAVLRVTAAIVQKEAKLCLIQGPPGTGKSKVIVNMVTQILYGENRYKNSRGSLRILVCAPSNAAIDEIVLRLLAIRPTFSKQNRFKMVRMGRPETMHPAAKDISVTELAKRDVKRTTSYLTCDRSTAQFDEEMRHLEAQMNALKCEIISTQNTDEAYKKHIKMKLTDMAAQYDLLKIRKPLGEMDPKHIGKLQRAAENKILLGADIITCTLSSCYTNQMESIFGANRESISVCIVDEATQSCEAETLIPLMLGVKTLVLVGDPNQLPATVISQEAKKLGLDQSLFSRMQNIFEKQPNNPIIMLDTQYRMEYPISYWPNKYFYGGKLKNAADTNLLFPYHSYRILNLNTYQNNDKFSNTNEAEFIANMIFCMMTIPNIDNWVSNISVGILTPYNNQKSMILTKINEKVHTLSEKIRKKLQVEVNTVDSFQGQERDIIIMSCVRSQGIGFLSDRQRLCVALTRAKHSLILCGNFNTFMKDNMWSSLLLDAKSRGVYCNISAKALLKDIKVHIVK